VSEAIQFFRGHSLSNRDLRRPGGQVSALATLELAEGLSLVDLDDPQSLLLRGLRPSRVATGERDVSQQVARGVYSEGAAGLSWWSTIEASWTNLTLFDERCRRALTVADRPVPLTTKTPELLAAAERLGIVVE
jgi:RES domain